MSPSAKQRYRDLSNPPECSHPQFVVLNERYRPLDRSCRVHRRPASSPRFNCMSDTDPRIAARARCHVCARPPEHGRGVRVNGYASRLSSSSFCSALKYRASQSLAMECTFLRQADKVARRCSKEVQLAQCWYRQTLTGPPSGFSFFSQWRMCLHPGRRTSSRGKCRPSRPRARAAGGSTPSGQNPPGSAHGSTAALFERT